MQNVYVMDTNVVIHDPKAFYKFPDSLVVLPLTVTEELDRVKLRDGIVGKNARLAARELDTLTREVGKSVGGSVELGNGSTLVFAMLQRDWAHNLPFDLAENKADNKILAIAIAYNQKFVGKVILLSNDINLRLKARALGLMAEEYEIANLDISELYTGITEISISFEEMSMLYQEGCLKISRDFYPNQAVLVSEHGNPKHSALAVAKLSHDTFMLELKNCAVVSGIRPKNKEQQLALSLLLDDSLSLVSLVGKAGTGKTLLALAAALQKVNLIGDGPYSKIVVSRPIMPMGRDVGFLPGDLDDKLRPWIQPIIDNLSFLGYSSTDPHSGTSWKSSDTFSMLQQKKILEVEALTYIRGRSIPNVFLIVDEAQNLSPHEVKTILTRAGEGTKVVLTGDIDQIDNPYLDPISNGLTYVIEKAKQYEKAGHMTMTKGERSNLADWASRLL